MSIRDNLIQSFTPHVRGDYTYEELLAIRACYENPVSETGVS